MAAICTFRGVIGLIKLIKLTGLIKLIRVIGLVKSDLLLFYEEFNGIEVDWVDYIK